MSLIILFHTHQNHHFLGIFNKTIHYKTMNVKIFTAIPTGYSGQLIEVEGTTNKGLPSFNLVGMGDKTILESRERVRSAIMNSDFSFPKHKITINLAPADLIKSGSSLDLPIAINILILAKQLREEDIKGLFFTGELSLDGSLKPVKGILNIIETAKNHGFKQIFLPATSAASSILIQGVEIYPVRTLKQLFLHLKHQSHISPLSDSAQILPITTTTTPTRTPDSTLAPPSHADSSFYALDQIQGLDFAKRALILAIAGHHNLLLSGPPGSGKTLLINAAKDLLPPPSPAELISIYKIHGLTTELDQIPQKRPFRQPHHSSSACSIIGGGSPIIPGEISLAHHGILFLDELPEFPRSVLEALRQPLEDHQISISRAKERATFPANFTLFATMNPCPCGYYGSHVKPCTCTPTQIHNYTKHLSGPIFDRIDIKLHLPYLDQNLLIDHLSTKSSPENSAKNLNFYRDKILHITELQAKRYHSTEKFNGTLTSAEISQYIHLTPILKAELKGAAETMKFSSRAIIKIVKLSRTIADFDESPEVRLEHLKEAICFTTFSP